MRLDRLPARPDSGKNGDFHVVVETPGGSRNKLKYDPELRHIVFSRPLVLGVTYPYDWGFVPSTLAPDGDPLDAMVVIDGPTAPGVVIRCRPIGAIVVTQKRKKGGGRERNDRLVAVPSYEPRWSDVRDLPERWRKELERFFVAAVFLEDKKLRIEGWDGPRAAEKLVADAERAFARGHV